MSRHNQLKNTADLPTLSTLSTQNHVTTSVSAHTTTTQPPPAADLPANPPIAASLRSAHTSSDLTDPTLLQLHRAFASPDPHTLTKLVRSLIGPRGLHRFRNIRGPDSHPLTLGTIELFCWGSYQSNFMIEDSITTLA